MIKLDITNVINQIAIIALILVLLYLGWKIRIIYKDFIFYLLRKKGKMGERKAKILLNKNGYKILSFQHRIKGFLYEDKKKIFFEVRPDHIVEKNNIEYIAEFKTGSSAFIGERNTRRQLLEYSKLFNSDQVLLVELSNNKIKLIEF